MHCFLAVPHILFRQLRMLLSTSPLNGREFDNSWKRKCPEAFRLNEVIEGWQIALLRMHPGSRWIVYIPYTMGYGTRTSGPIPAYSTLIFEVELLNIS